MIHINWPWLALIVLAAFTAGIFVAACCATAGRDDERMEAMHAQIKQEGYHV